LELGVRLPPLIDGFNWGRDLGLSGCVGGKVGIWIRDILEALILDGEYRGAWDQW